MRIVLNTESLYPPLTGIGNYTLMLLRGLHGHPEIQDVGCFSGHLWSREEISHWLASSTAFPRPQRPWWVQRIRSTARGIPGVYPLWAWTRHTQFRMAMQGRHGAVYHEPNYVLKPYGGPRVVTVHDLSHEHYPHFHPRERIKWLNGHLEHSMFEADRVITVSEYVGREVKARFPDCAEKVVTVHNGINPVFYPRTGDETANVLKQHGLSHGRYVFSAATREPRKNLEGLLMAYLAIPEPIQTEYPLVLASAPGWRSGRLERALDKALETGRVKALGYIPEQDLAHLYAGATLFAFVSFYEGFGLPVAEAMASGIPVLTSNRASMPEVAGDAGVLVDPGDIDAMSEQILRLLEDSSLRARHSQLGTARAGLFTSANCLEQTISVYRSVMQ